MTLLRKGSFILAVVSLSAVCLTFANATPHCPDHETCCVKYGINCPPEGSPCSTGGGFLPPLPFPCGKSLTCVIFDFGFPPVDQPNRGVCKKLSEEPPKCSIDFCSMNSAKAVCKPTDGISKVAFCDAWATRTDGFPGPDCGFLCAKICEEDGPFGSDGVQYCSLCQLQAASCLSNFKLFGPVPKPH